MVPGTRPTMVPASALKANTRHPYGAHWARDGGWGAWRRADVAIWGDEVHKTVQIPFWGEVGLQ